MARALPDLERIEGALDDAGPPAPPSVRHFADADLVRLEDSAVVAWVRGRRPGYDVHHGSPCGAGLLRVASKAGGELLERRPLAADDEGEWHGRAGALDLRRGVLAPGIQVVPGAAVGVVGAFAGLVALSREGVGSLTASSGVRSGGIVPSGVLSSKLRSAWRKPS